MYDFDIGDVIAGKYEIKQVLGVGGMGKVYRARQVDLGRDVALKIPSQAVLQSPEVMARFAREARTVAKLSHENIVQVYEYLHEGELAFIAMEFVEGEDMKAFTARRPKDLTVGQMARILELACEGMAHAHEHGIVHRDIKPHNIMVARLPRGKWRVKVMDFGIAHIDPATQFAEVGSQLTQTGQALGTPTYMAPEQIRGHDVSHLSDIYSFGCVIFYVFTQSTVFSGSGLTVAVSHLNEQPPSLRSRIPNISEKFDELILQCLEKDPAKRPQHAAELGARILDSLHDMRDVSMEDIWKFSGRLSDTIIPIIASTGLDESGSDQQQLIEVQTQQTIARTDTGRAGQEGEAGAPTRYVSPFDEAPTQLDAAADGNLATIVSTVPSEAPPVPRKHPARSKPAIIVGTVALSCLVVGVVAAFIIGGRDKEPPGLDNNQIAVAPTPTPLATPPDREATPTPAPTSAGSDTIPVPTPEQTPTRTPERTATPTPSPTPGPTPDVRMANLTNFRSRAAEIRDFVTQIEYWARIMELVDPGDGEFTAQVLQTADNIAERAVRAPEMVDIVGGVFTMGNDQGYADERPQHNVQLSPYRIGKYEVTALEFATFLNANSDIATVIYKPDGSTTVQYDDGLKRFVPAAGKHLHPANKVSWQAASDYAAWLSGKTGRVFRLPTEAEWERAARGSPPATYPWGESAPSRANVNFNSNTTVVVNSMSEGSSFDGCFHMAGNVAEWCEDWYSGTYYQESRGAVNPRGPDLGGDRSARRVYRGGSFISNSEQDLVASRRSRWRPEDPQSDMGFRLAETQ